MNFQRVIFSAFAFLKSQWYLIVLFVVIAIFYYMGSFYENETDIFFVSYAKGLLTAKPLALPETYILQILYGDVTAYLYSHFPNFEWYDCLTFCFTFFIGALLFKIYELLKESLTGNTLLRISTLFFFIGLFAAIALIPEITRHSFLIIILAFTVILLKLLYPEKISELLLFISYTVFLLSSLRRPEPAIALTFLFICYLLLLSFENKFQLNRAIKIIMPCLLLLLGVFVYTHIPQTPEGERYLKVVPYENTLVDFKGNLSDVHLQSKEDTIKYNAASLFFFCDIKHLNPDFFQKIGVVPLDKSPYYLFNYITRISVVKDRSIKLARDIWENENGLFLLSIFLNLLWMFFAGKSSIKIMGGRLSFSVVFWSTFLFANLFMKVETKVNESLLLFMIMMLLVCLITAERINKNTRIAFSISIAILACIVLKGYGLYQLYQTRENDARYVDRVRGSVNNLVNALVVLNITCWDEISIRLFDHDTYNQKNTYLSFDNGVLYLYDEYNSHMKRVTGRTEFIDQFDFVAKHPDAYWFSSEARMKMITEYVNVIYGKRYEYSLVKEIDRDKTQNYDSQLIGVYKLVSE